ncbi:MAG: type II toxin-antitoxin system VapC family toxin [Halobacteriales archaeon]
MSESVPEPLFVDTAAFFARFNERAPEHERATTVFDKIRRGDVAHGPLFTSRYVLQEFATLMNQKVGHTAAVDGFETIRHSSSFNVLPVGADTFDRSVDQFRTYDDQEISFVDHTSAVLASAREVEHVFTFDGDDFRTLGFTVVPDDTGES